jgi:hypothetical protein
MSPRWKRRPEGSNWGDFGPNDQVGRLNLLNRDAVRRGTAEVQEGRSFALSLPLDYPGGSDLNPNRWPPMLRPLQRKGHVNFNCVLGDLDPGRTDVLSDDMVILSLQYSTQWDGLAHVGSMFDADGDGVPEAVDYNGYRAGEHVVGPERLEDTGVPPDPGAAHSTSAAQALGIERMARTCVQGRGVMLDLRAHHGDARMVIGYDDLMRVIEADGITFEPGDILCLHTGFAELVVGMRKQPDGEKLHNACAVLDGRDQKLLQWITDTPIANRGRQLCRQGFSSSSGTGVLRGPASARTRSVQAGRPSGRAVAAYAARRVVAGPKAAPFPFDRSAPGSAWSDRLSADARREGLNRALMFRPDQAALSASSQACGRLSRRRPWSVSCPPALRSVS